MRRVEIIDGINKTRKGLFHGLFSEGDLNDGGVCTFGIIEVDNILLTEPTFKFRFLDPPEEEKTNLESDVVHLGFAYNALDKKIDELTEKVQKFGNTESLTKQVYSEVLQLRHDCDDVIKKLTKRVEKLEQPNIESDIVSKLSAFDKPPQGKPENQITEVRLANIEKEFNQTFRLAKERVMEWSTLNERVEKLEAEMKATVCAFANLGIPTSPARIDSEPPQPTYTREEVGMAYDNWRGKNHKRKGELLSELDKVKECKE